MRKRAFVLVGVVSTVCLAALPSSEAKAAFEIAEEALSEGKLDVAEAAYQEALDASPLYAPALNGLGSVLFRRQKVPEAIAKFRAAAEAEPSFKLAWFNLAYAGRKSSDFTTAILAYEKYTELDPKDPDGFFGLAESYRGAGQRDKAIAAYRMFLERESRPTEQRWINRANERIAELKAGPALSPPAMVAPTTTATAQSGRLTVADGDKFWAEKRYRDANSAYQDAVRSSPNDVEARFKLGNSYAVLADYPKAFEAWTAVQQISNDPIIQKSAADNIERAKLRQQGITSPKGASDGAANSASRPQTLPFGVIENPERGHLEAGSSLRFGSKYWQFVVTYTNTTGRPFRSVTVECVTLAGSRVLNVDSHVEFDGAPVGETLVFKVAVQDVAETAEMGSCRVTKAVR